MTGEFKRKLDLAANASIDIVALNNQVVKMRPIVKRSKVHVIHKLTKNIKKLRGKKGTEEQKKQNLSRANNLVEEIKVIKVLRPDYISKYALGSTETFEKLICQPNLDMERRALARLAEHHFIQDFVKKFRAEHSDWKELTAYLMTKHTSREFKKKKPNQKLAKVATNVKATENIVETYLGDKLKNTTTETDTTLAGKKVKLKEEKTSKAEKLGDGLRKKRANILIKNLESSSGASEGDSDDNENLSDSGSVTESDSDEQNNDRLKINKKVISKVRNDYSGNNFDEDNDSHDNIDEEDGDVHSDDNNDTDEETSEHGQEDSDSHSATDMSQNVINKQKASKQFTLESKTSSSESEFESEPHNVKKSDKDAKSRPVQSQMKKVNKKTTGEKLKQKSKRTNKTDQVPSVETKSFPEKSSGEMIVKKINLEEWTEDSIDTETSKTVPEFLLKTALPKMKRKIKDPFFCTNDDANSDDDVKSDNDKNNDVNSGIAEDIENADNEFDRESNAKSDEFTGIRGLNTTFVGSLKSSKMMKCDDPQYRSNEDWKKKRHEMKGNKFSEGRGRGGFDGPRGRGQFTKGRGGNARGTRGQGQQTRGRGDSRGHRGGFRGHGRGYQGHSDSQSTRDYGSPSFKQAQNSGGSKKSSEEKLLQPSWLKQGTTPASKTSEKLHPSWLASKKRKEQQTSIQTFQGKKIKFDD